MAPAGFASHSSTKPMAGGRKRRSTRRGPRKGRKTARKTRRVRRKTHKRRKH